MTPPRSAKLGLAWPSVLVWCGAFVPVLLIVIVSFSENIQSASWQLGFVFDNYARLSEARYLDVLLFSLIASVLVAVVSVAIGFPFTYFITRLSYRAQVAWLIFLLAGLSLSEVLIAFAWQVLLSRNIGLSGLLVSLGMIERTISLQPGFGAMFTALVYFVLPFTFLLFYPPLSRMDPSLLEAARTMGASPLRTFFSVVIPINKLPIIGSLILVFVLVLGAYVTPSQLGRPQHWTLSVHITDQATTAFNLPFAAALAVLLLTVSLALIALSARLSQRTTVA